MRLVASAVLFQQSFTCRGAAGASGRGGPCLGAWEPWGHQDQGCPCPPAIPRQLQGGPGCPPEGQLWSASARAGGLQGRLWLSPGLAPLAAQALSRSPLKTGRSRLGACGLLESAGSRGRGCAARGVGALLLTRPEGQSMHSVPWSSHVHICSGILRKRGCGRHAWCQALGEAGLCVHTQSPGELTEPAEPTPRSQALERRMVQSSSASVRLTRRAAGSLFGTV